MHLFFLYKLNIDYVNFSHSVTTTNNKGVAKKASFLPLEMFSSYIFKTHEPRIWAEKILDLSNLKTLVSAGVFSEIAFELYFSFGGDKRTYHQICIYSKIDISYDTYDIHIFHMISIFCILGYFYDKNILNLKCNTNAKSWFDSSSPSDGYYGHCDLIWSGSRSSRKSPQS